MTAQIINLANRLDTATNPDNAMISAGEVQLRRITPFLCDLPNAAVAELLVSARDTAVILEREPGTWIEDVTGIRSITQAHGVHFDGEALRGMQVFDLCEEGCYDSVEAQIANELRKAWSRAQETGKAVTTDLFMGTNEIVVGREIENGENVVANNLYELREQIAAQGGEFTTYGQGDDSSRQWSSTQARNLIHVYNVNFTNGYGGVSLKDDKRMPSRPVALRIKALTL